MTKKFTQEGFHSVAMSAGLDRAAAADDPAYANALNSAHIALALGDQTAISVLIHLYRNSMVYQHYDTALFFASLGQELHMENVYLWPDDMTYDELSSDAKTKAVAAFIQLSAKQNPPAHKLTAEEVQQYVEWYEFAKGEEQLPLAMSIAGNMQHYLC